MLLSLAARVVVAGLICGLSLFHGEMAVAAKAVFWSQAPENGPFNLWVTDGTPAGTKMLTVKGAYGNGVVAPSQADFTSFQGKVLFAGMDTLSKTGLWVTDGTDSGEVDPVFRTV